MGNEVNYERPIYSDGRRPCVYVLEEKDSNGVFQIVGAITDEATAKFFFLKHSDSRRWTSRWLDDANLLDRLAKEQEPEPFPEFTSEKVHAMSLAEDEAATYSAFQHFMITNQELRREGILPTKPDEPAEGNSENAN